MSEHVRCGDEHRRAFLPMRAAVAAVRIGRCLPFVAPRGLPASRHAERHSRLPGAPSPISPFENIQPPANYGGGGAGIHTTGGYAGWPRRRPRARVSPGAASFFKNLLLLPAGGCGPSAKDRLGEVAFDATKPPPSADVGRM